MEMRVGGGLKLLYRFGIVVSGMAVIGDYVKIEANTVITKDIADGCTAVGFNRVKNSHQIREKM